MNALPPNHPDDPGSAVMDAFAGRVEGESAITPPGHNLPVMIRPVGAQAIAIRRDPAKVLRDLRTFAAAAGDSWYFRWPVKTKDGKTEYVEGPSVKLANDLARLYGNCAVTMDRVDDIGTHWVFYPRFIDYETGYEYQRPFQQRKSQRAGERMDADRAADIAFQIGASKALRNTIVNALGTFADFALTEAKTALVNKISKSLDHYRERALVRLGELDVSLPRVERAVGRPSGDWDAPIVARIIAEIQAINEGMATAEELYPLPPVDPVKKLKGFGDTRPSGPIGQEASPVRPAAASDAAAKQATVSAPGKPAAGLMQEIPAHDPDTGEIRDVPAFLERRPDPQAYERAALRGRFPNVPPEFIDGYMACLSGDETKPSPQNPKAARNWQVGYDAARADIEEGKNHGES